MDGLFRIARIDCCFVKETMMFWEIVDSVGFFRMFRGGGSLVIF